MLIRDVLPELQIKNAPEMKPNQSLINPTIP
jgi:hypothetical protein